MNILVFRVGQLGDTLAALPAFWVLREHFKKARMTLLGDVQHGKNYVLAKDLLDGAGLFDEFMTYDFHPSRITQIYNMASLMAKLRAKRFNTLAYLYPPKRELTLVRRDKHFFRLCGIKRFIGMDFRFEEPPKTKGVPLPALPFESDLTLGRLAASGIPVPGSGCGRFDLALGDAERRAVDAWLSGKTSDGARPWLGVAPGSKMPAKVWPESRYCDAVAQLIARFDLWPVVFGGPEDAEQGKRLIAAWGRGFNAAGELGLRASAQALGRCRIYFGNDTGTMHLAAAAKTPCVAIFSARDFPGRWNPCGVASCVLRTPIDCEGCMLTECVERKMECLMKIGTDAAVQACVDLWESAEARK